jgi:hypothetical protein
VKDKSNKMDNNLKEFIVIDESSKIFLINRPILVFFGNEEIDGLLKYYESKYRDYKLVYSERGEPITPNSILHLYRIHEFFLENKINTKKFHILYENRSVEYENLLGFFQFNFYYHPHHLNTQTPKEFFDSGEYPYRLDRDFEKVFLSLNRSYKEHRVEFKTFFDSNNLKDKSYYSFLWQDEKNFEENYHQPTHAQHDKLIHLYENSAINLLTETKYPSEELSIPSTFISEKTFRALAFPRPFILIGQRHTLKNLQKMGFRTFSDIIDESYDDLPDSERMDKIQEIILDLSKKPKEEIYIMWEKCIENYEHNRKSIFYHAYQIEENFKNIFGNQYKLINQHYLNSVERTKILKEW